MYILRFFLKIHFRFGSLQIMQTLLRAVLIVGMTMPRETAIQQHFRASHPSAARTLANLACLHAAIMNFTRSLR